MELLNAKNYLQWCVKMKMILMKEKCWQVIDDITKLNAEQIAAQNEQALISITLMVGNDQKHLVDKAKTGVEAWNNIKESLIKSFLSAQIRLMKRLFKRLEIGGSMDKHLHKIFMSTIVVAMEAWDEERLTLAAVKSKLLEEWDRKMAREKNESVFAAKRIKKTNSFTCYFCNKTGN